MSSAARRFGWVLNLDAELELARMPSRYMPAARLVAQLEVHGTAARALLGPRDVLVATSSGALRFVSEPSSLVGRAWCPTPRALAMLRKAGVEPEPHPPASVLARVNHRRFAHELGGGLAGQRLVQSLPALEELLAAMPRRWLLKRPLAFAGRGQLRVEAPLTATQRAWVVASLATDCLILEPLVTPTLELSLHGFVQREGAFELGRLCVQSVGSRGTYRGVRLAADGDVHENERNTSFAEGKRVAAALTRAGYFGPFGIDAYRYEDDGASGFCALGEINARYTMAFTVGFPKPPSELCLQGGE